MQRIKILCSKSIYIFFRPILLVETSTLINFARKLITHTHTHTRARARAKSLLRGIQSFSHKLTSFPAAAHFFLHLQTSKLLGAAIFVEPPLTFAGITRRRLPFPIKPRPKLWSGRPRAILLTVMTKMILDENREF